NQRRLASDAVAVMAEDRRADWSGGEPDEIGAEGEQHTRGRIDIRKELLVEHQRGRAAVQKEVIPLDRRADRRRDYGARQLLPRHLLAGCCHSRSSLDRKNISARPPGEVVGATGARDRAGSSVRLSEAWRPGPA